MRFHSIYAPLLRNRHLVSVCVREISASAVRCNVDEFPDGWETARPYKTIPGPNLFELVRWFLPGGSLHNADAVAMQKHMNQMYGPIARLPGIFGKPDYIFLFDPDHYETVFRTEGTWPVRRSVQTFDYYRLQLRPEAFKGMGGLVSDQGEQWQKLRTAVNPMLMSPRTVKSYMPGLDRVAQEFVQRVSDLRSEAGEMPADFGNWISLWALESVGLVALDRRLGVMTATRDTEADQLIMAVENFFRLAFEFELKPSIWRIYHTKQFRELIEAFDVLTKYITKYIDDAVRELDKNPRSDRTTEISVLQKLLEKNRHYAFLMTFDMIFGGIDTTSSAMATLLYHLAINPEKQENLRSEISRVLPNKNSSLTTENFGEFAYFRACLKESMRLQPQVTGNLRGAGKNIVLDGYRIPKHTELFMANNVLQTTDQYFAKSKQFLPERWLRDDQAFGAELKSQHPFVYLPFGFGRRMCIGKRFAEMEIQILTARLLSEYRVEWHHGPMQYMNALVVKPSSELKFKMVPLK